MPHLILGQQAFWDALSLALAILDTNNSFLLMFDDNNCATSIAYYVLISLLLIDTVILLSVRTTRIRISSYVDNINTIRDYEYAVITSYVCFVRECFQGVRLHSDPLTGHLLHLVHLQRI